METAFEYADMWRGVATMYNYCTTKVVHYKPLTAL